MQTKLVFFDIGDVLFDEDAQHRYLFHSMLLAMRRNGVDVTWDDYFDRPAAARARSSRQGFRGRRARLCAGGGAGNVNHRAGAGRVP